ncbi:MAG: hypothetical protein GY851_00380 [bacterium]|nr:hypothetical protein [bacterium]
MAEHQFLPWLQFDGAPGVDSETDPVDLKATHTPAGYGFDLDTLGRLKKGTIPSGDTRIAKGVTISTVPYIWHYNRLWNKTNRTAATASNTLTFGAPLYDDVYYAQGLGKIPFSEDAATIVEFLPFGGDSMAIGKSTGSYVLRGVTDPRGADFWRKGDIIQEIKLATAANATELDSVAYFSAADGLFSFGANGSVTDLTRRVRDSVSDYANIALKPDYSKKRIVGTAKFVYDAETDRLFNFATSGFLWTSPTLHARDFSPFIVDRFSFVIENTSTDDQTFTVQYKLEEDDWYEEHVVEVLKDTGTHTVVHADVFERKSVKKFQVRITAMDGGLAVREVRFDAAFEHFDAYGG